MNNEPVDLGIKAQVLHKCFNNQGNSVMRICLKQERGTYSIFLCTYIRSLI